MDARTRATALSLAAALAGCGGDAVVQLVLAPDPELNSTAEVAAQVARVQVVVDAEGGLGVDQPGPTAGGGEAADRDGDGALEVVFTSPPLDRAGGDLPVLEIGLGDQVEAELAFQLLGFAADAPLVPADAIALGGTSATCPADATCRVGTPFNLLSRARAPRVVWVVPPDGALDVPANLAYVTAVFSTRVDPATVAPHVTLTGDEGHLPATTTEIEDVIYGVPPAPQEIRSMLQLVLGEPLEDLHYTLAIGPGVVGENGLRFDQRRDLAGEDGFVSHFGNESDAIGCPDGYQWSETYYGCEAIPDCAAGCGDGFVCDPAAQQCVDDCRVYGACLDPARRCDAQSGLCG